MYSRRDFIRTASLTAGALALNLHKLSARAFAGNYFSLNDRIEAHPDAVFIFRTAVNAKTNAAAIKEAGRRLGRTLFVQSSSSGFHVTTPIALKPNLTAWSWQWDGSPIETLMGIQTDANFVEGIVDSFKDLGVAGASIFIPEANYNSAQLDGALYRDMAARAGITLQNFSALDRLPPGQVQWADVPNPVWFRRIPYLWPVNSPGSCLINIAKFKSHSMGMTLCSKNLQGTIASPYVAHCSSWGQAMPGVHAEDVVTNAMEAIKANYDRHILSGIPRWEKSGNDAASGLGMETHSSRCLDNNTVLRPLINIIEGVYGREGPFVAGPADNGGHGRDIMANLVIFGKNARHVDLIGTYLAGHEPGNFGFFHMAVERGLSKYLDPRLVPLYEWKLDGSASSAALSDFPRVPIRTLYLRKTGEADYHMVDEPYTYPQVPVEVVASAGEGNGEFGLHPNYPNPFNPATTLSFTVAKTGRAALTIYNAIGTRVAVVFEGMAAAGMLHRAVFNASRLPGGVYFAVLESGALRSVRRMALVK